MHPGSSQLALQQTLQTALTDAQTRNPAYSLRSFASKLGLSPSSLSEILNGKRRVSRKIALRVTERLCLPPEQKDALLGLFPQQGTGELPEASKVYTLLSADQFHIVSEWQHFAILSLAETKGFKGRASWIAERLGIKQSEAQTALDRLLRMGLLAVGKRGDVVSTGNEFTSSDDVTSSAVKRAHVKNLELAASSLDRDAVTARDFSAVTMAIDPAHLPVAKKMIREFQDRLSLFLETGNRTEVYKVCMQLFPLTQSKEGSVP